ncbi:MAG: esterase family protein, partial [Chloroflexi bacterium]|nr:esterase family protein [Chloroflexota bacterium]
MRKPVTCLQQPGQVVEARVPTQHIPPATELRVLIYLPPCYQAHPPEPYPLLILFHGQNYTADQWVRLGVPQALDERIRQGLASPLLVVMPEEPRALNWTLPPDNAFDQAVVDDLLPWLEAHYPVSTERTQRGVGGLSRGAGWAVRIGLQHWETFGVIGAHSPAIFWGDGSRLLGWLEAIPETALPQVSIDIADYDRDEIIQAATTLEDLLVAFDVPHRWRYNVGRHDEAYWRRQVPDYVAWYVRALG